MEKPLLLNYEQLPVVILCGGLGTRLRPILADRPKCLAEVNGKPFLTYLLDQVAAAGLSRVILATGYLSSQIRDAFGEHYRGLRLDYSEEREPLGTAGALRLATPYGCPSVLVLNGDSYCDVDLREFVASHFASGAKHSLVAAHVNDIRRFGSLRLRTDDSIEQFEEKRPDLPNPEPGIINAGIYMLSCDLVDSIPLNRPVSLEREIFPAWVTNGLHGWKATASFIDIGTPESLAIAGQYLAPYVQDGSIFKRSHASN